MNDGDLSRQLGSSRAFVNYLKKKKNYTTEQIIDNFLESPKQAFSYRGFSWRTDVDLSQQLGRSRSYVSYLKNKKNYTSEQIIDLYIDSV